MNIIKMTPEEIKAHQLQAIREPDISPADSLDTALGGEFNKCHDWRNHVPGEAMAQWNELTDIERKVIVYMAKDAANREEWDQGLKGKEQLLNGNDR